MDRPNIGFLSTAVGTSRFQEWLQVWKLQQIFRTNDTAELSTGWKTVRDRRKWDKVVSRAGSRQTFDP